MEKKYAILYIDDEKENLLGFKYTFRNDYRIFTAISANEGLKILENNDIQVVISDQRMPDMTGVEFFEKVIDNFPDIIRIIITGYTDIDAIIRAVNKGRIDKYISKPWNIEQLKITIDNAITSFNLKKENRKLLSTLQQTNQKLKKSNAELIHEINEHKNTENALMESEKKLKTIFNSSNDVIIISDLNGKILDINHAALNLFDYNRNHFLSNTITVLTNEKDKILQNIKTIQTNTSHIFSAELFTRQNKGIPFEINGKVVDYDGGKAILFMARDVTERKLLERKVMNAIIETEEHERRRFAEELHDGLGPLLSSIKMYVNFLAEKKNEAKKASIIQGLFEVIDEAIIGLKEISNKLSPHILDDFGLIAAIKTFSEKISSSETININVHTNDEELQLHKKVEIVLYRIICELINNTIKHAEASQIHIKLMQDNNLITLQYTDDGKGFSTEDVMKYKNKGLGLINIQNRIQSYNGKFTVESRKNEGAKVTIRLNNTYTE